MFATRGRSRSVWERTFLIASFVVLGSLGLGTPAWAGGPSFIRGDANLDGSVDIADAVTTLAFLFGTGSALGCNDAADSNDDGSVDIGDPISTLGYLFSSGTIPAPFPDCGVDPTADSIGCDYHPICMTFPPAPEPPVLGSFPSLTTETTVTISGTAGLSAVSGQVVGPQGTFEFDVTNGAFTVLDVPLASNSLNNLFVTVEDQFGFTSAPAVAAVTNDQQAPDLFLDFPADGAMLTTDVTDVAGRVSDTLSGFNGLEVMVNGAPAIVDIGIGTNGTFFLQNVALNLTDPPTPTTITAIASDTLGNTQTVEIDVTRLPLTGPQMTILAGNAQTGSVNSLLPTPLIVEVLQGDGTPLADKLVTFEVTRSNGRLTPNGVGEGALSLQVLTDGNGLATAFLRLGDDAGCGNNRVEVTSQGINGTVFFCATATPGPAAQINVGSGNNQVVEVGAVAPQPLRAWVNDSCNGVGGVDVTFTVVSGGGTVNGLAQATVTTSPTGHAEVEFALGPVPGPNSVIANFPNNQFSPVTFVATGLFRDPAMPTSFRGLVLNNGSQVIGGATCTLNINGVDVQTVLSDVEGVIAFDNIPDSGFAKLHVDGSTATTVDGVAVPAFSYPGLTYYLVIVPNAVNRLPTPVLIPPLDPANVRSYSTTNDTILEIAGMEGLQMRVFAGSMTLDDGNGGFVPAPDGTPITLNQVHHDDIPMPMPDGAAPPFAWTLQPHGAHFDPPIEITYPNMSALPPGAVAYFLNFDHDVNQFSIVASGRVSTDGSVIVSDPGDGLDKAGWGCNCPPYSVATDCEFCEENCVDEGMLTGGNVTVDKEAVCVGDPIEWTISDVTDSGGGKEEICEDGSGQSIPIDPGTIEYTWEISKDGTPLLSGTGQTAPLTPPDFGVYTCVFTVTTDRDCAPAPLVTAPVESKALKLTITNPMADGDVFLQGTEMDWTAKLEPAVPAGEVMWNFSYTAGNGEPDSGTGMDMGGEQHFCSTVTSEGTVTLEVSVTVAGETCMETRTITTVKPEVTAISFLNDFPLRHWVNNDMGNDIMDPVWEKTLGGTVTKNDPAAYKRSVGGADSMMTASLQLSASSNLTDSANIRVRGMGVEDFMFEEGSVQTWPSMAGVFDLESDPIPGYNGVYNMLDVTWEYIVQKKDGSWPDFADAITLNMSSHKVYCTYDTPTASPLFDLALEKVCLEYADGLTTVAGIAAAANTGIDADLCYNPGVFSGDLPLNGYTLGQCLCWNNAAILELLVESVGIPGELRFFYGGLALGAAETFTTVGGAVATMRTTAGGHDLASPMSHFTYHVQTRIAGTYYDPSYGTIGQAMSTQECDGVGAMFLEGPAFPTFFDCMWVSPAGPDPAPPGCP